MATRPAYSAADLLRRAARDESPDQADSYIARVLQSTESAAMPQFEARLQDIREGAIRRGVSNGDLATSYEGDLASAFQRNITNTAGSLALTEYENSRNRMLDLLTGERDYDTMLENLKRKRRAGLFGGLGALAGAAVGSFVPGIGTEVGAEVGAAAGSGIGG